MKTCRSQTRDFLESEQPLELSFVELVVAASECSEDEGEIFELVDGLLQSGRVTLQVQAEQAPDLLDAA